MYRGKCIGVIVCTVKKRVTVPMDLDLQEFVGTGNQNQVLCKNDMYPSSLVSYLSCLITCLDLIMSASIKATFYPTFYLLCYLLLVCICPLVIIS